jgi:hypothetical protein
MTGGFQEAYGDFCITIDLKGLVALPYYSRLSSGLVKLLVDQLILPAQRTDLVACYRQDQNKDIGMF